MACSKGERSQPGVEATRTVTPKGRQVAEGRDARIAAEAEAEAGPGPEAQVEASVGLGWTSEWVRWSQFPKSKPPLALLPTTDLAWGLPSAAASTAAVGAAE